MAKPPAAEIINLDPSLMGAETPAEYAKRGWAYFSTKKFDLSAEDFRKALSSDAGDVDSWYGLGLALKGSGTTSKALEAFEKILESIGSIEDRQRASVLSRLVKGQINMMKTGDWNLEKEVWKNVS